jgi:hypothetical protein
MLPVDLDAAATEENHGDHGNHRHLTHTHAVRLHLARKRENKLRLGCAAQEKSKRKSFHQEAEKVDFSRVSQQSETAKIGSEINAKWSKTSETMENVFKTKWRGKNY